MNLQKGFKIATLVISIIAFLAVIAAGIIDNAPPSVCILAFGSFAIIWLIYWIVKLIVKLICWIVKWIDKEKTLYVIKWAVIIFLASVLFHLADYFVHKTTKSIEKRAKISRWILPNQNQEYPR